MTWADLWCAIVGCVPPKGLERTFVFGCARCRRIAFGKATKRPTR